MKNDTNNLVFKAELPVSLGCKMQAGKLVITRPAGDHPVLFAEPYGSDDVVVVLCPQQTEDPGLRHDFRLNRVDRNGFSFQLNGSNETTTTHNIQGIVHWIALGV